MVPPTLVRGNDVGGMHGSEAEGVLPISMWTQHRAMLQAKAVTLAT